MNLIFILRVNIKLDELSATTKTLIGEYLSKDDVEAVRRLSETAVHIKKLHEQFDSLEKDIANVANFLKCFVGPLREAVESVPRTSSDEIDLDFDITGIKSRAKKLRIEIDWKRAGKALDTEVLSDHKASSTMARFFERLAKVHDQSTIEKLTKFRINRGPLVSKNPKHDFLNRSAGTLYGNQEISGTGYWVLTHSSTTQKVADLREICRFLGLPVGMVKITEAEK